MVDAAIKVHRVLGPGLLESVYEAAMASELSRRGLRVERQVPIDVMFEGENLGMGFRIDLLVERMVLIELKSVETVSSVFRKQTKTYMRLASLNLGFLINFNTFLVKDGIERFVNNLENAKYGPSPSPSSPASRDPE